jgi:hypothetical protein
MGANGLDAATDRRCAATDNSAHDTILLRFWLVWKRTDARDDIVPAEVDDRDEE